MSNIFVADIIGSGTYAIPVDDAALASATAGLDTLISGVANLTYDRVIAWVQDSGGPDGAEGVRTLNCLIEKFLYSGEECPSESEIDTLTAAIEAALEADPNITSVDQQQFSIYEASSVSNFWKRDTTGGFLYPTTTTDDIAVGGNVAPTGKWFNDGDLVLGASLMSGTELLRVVGDARIEGKLTVTGLIDPTGVVITEQGSCPWTDVAGYGCLWVRNDTPSTLWFTDDAGTDTPVSLGSYWTRAGGILYPTTLADLVVIGTNAASGNQDRVYVYGNSDSIDYGIRSHIYKTSATAGENKAGIVSYLIHNSTTGANTYRGFQTWLGIDAASTTVAGFGYRAIVECSVAGAIITTYYGLRIDNDSSGGSITNSYGIYVASMGGTSSSYGIYQAGASDKNVFIGEVVAGDSNEWGGGEKIYAVDVSPTGDGISIIAGLDKSTAGAKGSWYGVYSWAGHTGSGNATAYRNFWASTEIGTAAITVTDSYGLYDNVFVGATSTITNHYGVYLSGKAGTGTLTNAFGIWISAQNGGTLSYGIFQNGASDINAFMGSVAIATGGMSGSERLRVDGGVRLEDFFYQTDAAALCYYLAPLAVGRNTMIGDEKFIVYGNADSYDYAARLQLEISSAAAGADKTAVYAATYHSAAVAATQYRGVYADVNMASAYTLTTAVGYEALVTVAGSGTITTYYGVKIDTPQGAGTVTNSYGIYISAMLYGTAGYGIYQNGTADLNVFRGDVVIGGTAMSSTELLRVVGAARIEGKLTVTGLIDPTGMVFDDQATVPGGAPGAGKGTLWVKNDTPTTLKFTDSAGGEYQIGYGWGKTGTVVHLVDSSDSVSIGRTSLLSTEKFNSYSESDSVGYAVIAELNKTAHTSGISRTGVESRIYHSGNINAAYSYKAFNADIQMNSAYTLNYAYGLNCHLATGDASAVVTTYYGVRLESPTGTGSVTNSYGIYISDLGGTSVNYGIYQSGTSSLNYFGGNVGINKYSPDVNRKLDIADNQEDGTSYGVYTLFEKDSNASNKANWYGNYVRSDWSATSDLTGEMVGLYSYINFAPASAASIGGTAYSYRAYLAGNANTTLSSYYGIYISTSASTNEITYSYGLYIGTMDRGSTNSYAIYQAGSTDYNYFNGYVGLNDASPSYQLDCNGDARFVSEVGIGHIPATSAMLWITQLNTISNIDVTVSEFDSPSSSYTYASVENIQTVNSIGSTDTVTSLTSILINSPGGTGDISTNIYGLYIETQKTGPALTVTNAYGIYQAGGSDINIFNGDTSVGHTGAPTSALDVSGDIEVASGDFIYWGDPNTDGSWCLGRNGNNMIFQRRESGSWVVKQTISA